MAEPLTSLTFSSGEECSVAILFRGDFITNILSRRLSISFELDLWKISPGMGNWAAWVIRLTD